MLTYSSLLLFTLVISGCNTNRAEQKLAQDAKQLEGENFDTDLTFNSVTLEDFDQEGRLWWKVKAKQATYSRDKKIARVKKPNGKFYQDGKAILTVSGDEGEVLKDGERMFLRGNIIAKDLRDGLILEGNELEWQPKNDIILIRNSITGNRRNIKASAQKGKYLTRQRHLELEGKVAAESKDPDTKLNAERLVWFVDKQKMISDRPLQIVQQKNGVVTDRARASQGEIDINTQVVTLKQSAQLDTITPPLQVTGNFIRWQIKEQLVSSTQPLTFNNPQDNVTLSGRQGNLNLRTKILTLVGDVRGAGGPRQSQLMSDRLAWNIETQQFQAEGNVRYQQSSPPLNLSGPRANGTLKNQQVVVSGGRVVTQFIP
jgi:LPS export ABC transporter protein LptC